MRSSNVIGNSDNTETITVMTRYFGCYKATKIDEMI